LNEKLKIFSIEGERNQKRKKLLIPKWSWAPRSVQKKSCNLDWSYDACRPGREGDQTAIGGSSQDGRKEKRKRERKGCSAKKKKGMTKTKSSLHYEEWSQESARVGGDLSEKPTKNSQIHSNFVKHFRAARTDPTKLKNKKKNKTKKRL